MHDFGVLMINSKVGKWIILEQEPKISGESYYFICRCECGAIKSISKSSLINNLSLQCRRCCSLGFRIEIKSGQKFNHWTVVKECEKKWGHRIFLCKCDCGTEQLHPIGNLKYGKSKQCKDCSKKLRPNYHGKVQNYLHSIWSGIIQRTSNPNNPGYHNYGGRGITVCEEWKTFINFFNDITSIIGNRPSSNHLLDRINNNGNYEISNVRWVTPKQNSANRRISLKPGEKRKSMMVPIEELKKLGYFN